MKTNYFEFEITGGFEIDERYKPVANVWGEICGFQLPDGTEVSLIAALDVLKAGTRTKYTAITKESEMDELGFSCLDYETALFRHLPRVSLTELVENHERNKSNTAD